MPKRPTSLENRQLTWPHPILPAQWLSLVLFCCLLLLVGSIDISAAAQLLRQTEATQTLTIAELPPIPVLKSKVAQVSALTVNSPMVQQVQAAPFTTDPPILSATSYYAFDIGSQTQLAAKQESQVVPPASTTKLLTALTALKLYGMDQEFMVTNQDLFENQLQFTIGETIARDDLVAALLINSSNEAAYILARQYPTGVDGFVTEMNRLATELGMASSHFQNPAGFDHPQQISTARDLSVLARAAMTEPIIRNVVRQPSATITNSVASRSHQLVNTNKLLSQDSTVIGIKTGTTEEAKEVLISQFVRDGHQIQLVVLGSQDRYADTMQLLNWILDSYQWVLL